MISVNVPTIENDDIQALISAVSEGWISSSGPYVQEFEEKWAQYCGRRYGVAVSNGTNALELAVAALDLPMGAEVIVPSFTIISCAVAIVRAGLKPVFVDCLPDTWTINPALIEEKISENTRAIMPVHIYGHPCDMQAIEGIAKNHGLAIIEDAAQAHGASIQNQKCGSFGDVSCFSFFANKIITTGEGGMVLTDSELLYKRLCHLRNLAFDPERRYIHDAIGFNFRLTSMQAALGISQIGKIERLLERKKDIASRYTEAFSQYKHIRLPVCQPGYQNVYWMYGMVLELESHLTADLVMDALHARGVETRHFFTGLHKQPILEKLGFASNVECPVTDYLAGHGLYLPSGLGMTSDDQTYVIKQVLEVFDEFKIQ